MSDTREFAAATLKRVDEKMAAAIRRNPDVIPYTTDDQHRYIDMVKADPYWWTNGFWGGLLWQMHALTGDAAYKQAAIKVEQHLDQNLFTVDKLDHDNGFKWLLTAVAHYRHDGSAEAKNRALLAAGNMAGRFNLNGRYIRAWNDEDGRNRANLAIIDCLMNLPLLYWASAEEHDPRFKQIAVAHAEMAQAYMVRADGSVKHIVMFDPETGDYQGSQGGQGYAHGSSWTRGQAWGIYGFALSYHYTQDDQFLATAQRIANYFIANIPADGHIPIDFRMPAPFIEDASAAAIAASGLLTLAEWVAEADAALYRRAAVRLLRVLVDSGVDWDNGHDELLEHCSAQYNEATHEYPIIYGDYFFIEALMKLTGQVLPLW